MNELAPRCGRVMRNGKVCARVLGHVDGRCHARQDQREWFRQRNAEWHSLLAAYKTARGCAVCGFQSDRGGYFDLDHVNRDTLWAGKGVIYYARRLDPNNPEHVQRVLDELAKCQVLCVACHREKTGDDLAGDWQ